MSKKPFTSKIILKPGDKMNFSCFYFFEDQKIYPILCFLNN